VVEEEIEAVIEVIEEEMMPLAVIEVTEEEMMPLPEVVIEAEETTEAITVTKDLVKRDIITIEAEAITEAIVEEETIPIMVMEQRELAEKLLMVTERSCIQIL
jgi:hypothetical protein